MAEPAGAGPLPIPGSADVDRRSAAVTGAVVDGLVVSSLADDDGPAAGRGLTTVRQPTRLEGEVVVRSLLEHLAGRP